ncbi:UNVERIFIED_CONTAM: hypothetical protein Sradi_1538700 [Sesamum radiatum]|uniref:Retrotransposon gag domain-containing protein n=1 Tax=Sesamum radiatum TaxID=300843 RepID=A0AAW2UAJ7_SESRA
MPSNSQSLDEVVLAISERLTEISASMVQRHDSFAAAISDIQQHLATLPSPTLLSPPPQFTPGPSTTPPPPLIAAALSPPIPKSPKLQLQRFDGSASLDWVFQAEQYFALYQIPAEQCLNVVPFSMKGEALSWFKWMHTNRNLSSWEYFVELRFGPSTYDNHQATLFKLHQRGTKWPYCSPLLSAKLFASLAFLRPSFKIVRNRLVRRCCHASFRLCRPLRASLLFHAALLPRKCRLAVLVGDRGLLFRNQLSRTELTEVALSLRSSDEVVFYLTLFLSL